MKNKLTRSEKRSAKPCYHHKHNGQIDGVKIKRRRTWWEGAPYNDKYVQGVFQGKMATAYATKNG